METYMYNATPTRSTGARFSVNRASFSPGFTGTASSEIEAFIWRCKQDNGRPNERNTSYKSASRDFDSSSVTTFINMLTEVNTRCHKLEDQLLHLQEHTRRVTSQLDSIVSHHGDKSPSSAHPTTSSMDTMKAIRKLQWKIFDLQRENEALRGVLEVQRVQVDAEGEIANPPCPQEANPNVPWSYLDGEETSTPQDAYYEGSAFLHVDPPLSSDHQQQADLKKDVTSTEAHQQSTPSFDRRVVQQRVNSDQQNPQSAPFAVQQSGYSASGRQSTPKPSSADRRTVVDQQLNYNRNPQSISNFVTVDERLVQQTVISDDNKLVHNVEHPHNCINQKNNCGGVEILKDRSPGATSTPTRNSSYSTKWTSSGKKKYHYSRPPVGREEWRWSSSTSYPHASTKSTKTDNAQEIQSFYQCTPKSYDQHDAGVEHRKHVGNISASGSSPSTSYPHASTKSSTKTDDAKGIQSCYQSTPKSYYGDPHAAGVENRKHAGNISTLGSDYGYSNQELDDLELGEFNLYASPEDVRLVQGTLELLSTIKDMGYINEEVAT